MRTLRYWTHFTLLFLKRFKAILFFGVIVGLFVFIFLLFYMPKFFETDSRTIGVTGRYHVDELPNFVLEDIGDGLTTLSDDGTPEPSLASSWSISDDGKTWTFVLKDNLTWQDGKDLKSQDITYSFEDVTISYPDEKKIEFKLESPFSPFPTILSKPVFKKGLLGTGNWSVHKISLTSNFVQEILLVDKEGERKKIKFYPTQERTKLAYKLGKIDEIVELIDPAPFNEWNTSEVKSTINKSRLVVVFFNNEDPTFKDNKRLRQALSYAIDKNSLGPERALGPISPSSWGYNPQIKGYDYSPERAKELLKELPEETLASIDIKLTTTPTLLPVAEKIEKYWEDIGINTTVMVLSDVPSDFQAFLAMYDIPKDPDQYSTWHSTQTVTNISRYNNPRIDKLLEDGRLEQDTTKRKKIYLDFQRFLLEDAPAIFLYHPYSFSVTRK